MFHRIWVQSADPIKVCSQSYQTVTPDALSVFGLLLVFSQPLQVAVRIVKRDF